MEIKKGENANLAGMEPPEGKARNFDDPETIVDHIVGMVADDGSITDVARELAVDYVRTRLLYAGLERLAYIVEEKLTEPAGMEPRCPKCGSLNFSVSMVGRDNQIGTCGKCDCNLPVAQFFRSPAPTPPLDDNNPVVCSMRAAALAFGGDEDLEKAVTEGRMNMQGEWPTPSLDVEAAAQEINEDEITRIRTGRSRLTEKGIADILRRHIASPAQPEKRDEWVSVDEQLPEAEERVFVLTDKRERWVARCKQFDNTSKHEKIFLPEGLHPVNAVITHWQPLPAPPQSGKEGQ